ncbi:EF-hand domain-containing protein [Pseudomonas putida]|uniref:HvfA family oxazolone/thioamide-modified RiPP metallophore n=1 Tax=Pseudomonas TaxID=286 RepID=UPI0007B6DFFD|nr:EF-hand domain-containing protein [Pseudomonas putida]ANC01876.1 EF hand domain-containing protein [Pseudomonas putida]
MSHTPISTKARIGLFAIALAGGINVTSSAFAVEALPQGYQLAANEKAPEGKCGEGKCGAQGKATQAEGKCGGQAKVTGAEGKCGEGKCGDASFARTDTDHDGRVSRAELLAVAPKANAEFDAIDANHDGYLSEAETYQFRKHQFDANGKPFPSDLYSRLSQAKQ